MRIAMRIVAGVLGTLGLIIGAAGVAGAVYVGRDDTVPLARIPVTSDGVAVVTAPELITVFGPTLHVGARGPGTIFIGVAHEGDLASYLGDQRRTTLIAIAWPDTVRTSDQDGRTTATAPGSLHWWTIHAQGDGRADLAWPMADGRYSLVVMPASGRGPLDLTITVGLELDGLFATAATVAAGGLGVAALAVLVFVLTRRRAPTVPTEAQP